MMRRDFFDAIKKLNLDPKDYVVIGSGVLGALEILEVGDVDLVVSESVFRKFEQRGDWKRKDFEDGSYYLVKAEYDIGLDWDSVGIEPNLDDLKKDELIIEGIPFVSLERLKRWKHKKGRDKDIKDIALIDNYLRK